MDTHLDDPFIALKEKVLALKEKREAVILAHMYQRPEIQDIADYVEDSLGLAKSCPEQHLQRSLCSAASISWLKRRR